MTKLMKSLAIIAILIGSALLLGCQRQTDKPCAKPKKQYQITGYIDNGSGVLVEVGTLRAISKDGITVTGEGAYSFRENCLLRIYGAVDRVDYVTWKSTAGYDVRKLPTSRREYVDREKPNLSGVNPRDIYFSFPVIGDATFIVHTKEPNPGVDIGID